MKSEPSAYSIDNLQQDKETIWDGVRNYQARNFLRQMRKNDLAFFYHSNTKVPGIVGLMKVVDNVIDPTQFDSASKYYDAKATPENPRWDTVSVKYVETFPDIISLADLKHEFGSDRLIVARRGNRLSVMPIESDIAQQILAMARL